MDTVYFEGLHNESEFRSLEITLKPGMRMRFYGKANENITRNEVGKVSNKFKAEKQLNLMTR